MRGRIRRGQRLERADGPPLLRRGRGGAVAFGPRGPANLRAVRRRSGRPFAVHRSARGRVDRAVRPPHAWARCEGTHGEAARPRSHGHGGPRDNGGGGTRGLSPKKAAGGGGPVHSHRGGAQPTSARASPFFFSPPAATEPQGSPTVRDVPEKPGGGGGVEVPVGVSGLPIAPGRGNELRGLANNLLVGMLTGAPDAAADGAILRVTGGRHSR